jgi:hypothetical protein
MSNYGHPITFGLSLIPSVEALEENLRLAQAADQAGLDYLAMKRIQDSRIGPRRTIMHDKPISSGHRNREEMHA